MKVQTTNKKGTAFSPINISLDITIEYAEELVALLSVEEISTDIHDGSRNLEDIANSMLWDIVEQLREGVQNED